MKHRGSIILLSSLFLLFLLFCPGFCEERSALDTTQDGVAKPANQKDLSFNIGAIVASFFQKHLSAVDGDRCPSIPSCSSYSVQAFRKHGFFIGWLMTVDRLIHEGDEGSVSPVVKRDGRMMILDPVENNDFWWDKKNGKHRD